MASKMLGVSFVMKAVVNRGWCCATPEYLLPSLASGLLLAGMANAVGTHRKHSGLTGR